MGEAELNMSSCGDPSRQTSISDSTTDFEDDGQKKFEFAAQPAVNPATQSALHPSSPIIYHYLTFETLIPSPTSNVSSDGSSATAPPRPELKKYTSPFDWPESRKRFTVFLSCIATMLTAYTAGAYSPAVKQMSEYWHVSDIAILVGITTFCFG